MVNNYEGGKDVVYFEDKEDCDFCEELLILIEYQKDRRYLTLKNLGMIQGQDEQGKLFINGKYYADFAKEEKLDYRGSGNLFGSFDGSGLTVTYVLKYASLEDFSKMIFFWCLMIERFTLRLKKN